MNLKQHKKIVYKKLNLIDKIKWLWWDIELRMLDHLKIKWEEMK